MECDPLDVAQRIAFKVMLDPCQSQAIPTLMEISDICFL